MKSAAFRADASAAIGGGHVYRSLTLAQALVRSGWQCTLLTRTQSLSMLPKELVAGIKIETIGAGEGPSASRLNQHADIILFDHYGIGSDIEAEWRSSGSRVAIIDDCADRPHVADLIINPNARISPGVYRDLAPPGCEVLTGPDYAFVRQQFIAARPGSLAKKQQLARARRVYVNFGLTDPAGGSILALEALEALGADLHADFVIGAHAPGLSQLADRLRRSSLNHELHIDVSNVAELMSNADFAIAAGGSSSWERCVVGLPSVVMSLAENQRPICEALAHAGAALDSGDVRAQSSTVLREQLRSMIEDGESRRSMSRAAAQLCDGGGVDRIVCKFSMLIGTGTSSYIEEK